MAVPSAGCELTHRSGLSAGQLLNETVLWSEPGLPAVNRSVLTYVPTAATDATPVPLVMVFHGWGGHAIHYHDEYTFGALAEAAGFLAVYPEGLKDAWGSASPFTSWNAGDTTVEGIGISDALVCDPDAIASTSTCYRSCMIKKGRCHPCSWTTCYDDVGFVQQLLTNLTQRFCVDLGSIFAYGCSNGGLFVHQLARQLPNFKAIAAACGGKPHQGYEGNFTSRSPPVSMLLLQGTNDHTIPRWPPDKDSNWWDGYIYASDFAVLKAYREHNHCFNPEPRGMDLPPKVQGESLSCTEYGYDCLGGSTVVECLFAGPHDLVLAKGANTIMDGPELAWFFFCQASANKDLHCTLPQSSGGAPFVILSSFAVVILLVNLLLWSYCCSHSSSSSSPRFQALRCW